MTGLEHLLSYKSIKLAEINNKSDFEKVSLSDPWIFTFSTPFMSFLFSWHHTWDCDHNLHVWGNQFLCLVCRQRKTKFKEPMVAKGVWQRCSFEPQSFLWQLSQTFDFWLDPASCMASCHLQGRTLLLQGIFGNFLVFCFLEHTQLSKLFLLALSDSWVKIFKLSRKTRHSIGSTRNSQQDSCLANRCQSNCSLCSKEKWNKRSSKRRFAHLAETKDIYGKLRPQNACVTQWKIECFLQWKSGCRNQRQREPMKWNIRFFGLRQKCEVPWQRCVPVSRRCMLNGADELSNPDPLTEHVILSCLVYI